MERGAADGHRPVEGKQRSQKQASDELSHGREPVPGRVGKRRLPRASVSSDQEVKVLSRAVKSDSWPGLTVPSSSSITHENASRLTRRPRAFGDKTLVICVSQ